MIFLSWLSLNRICFLRFICCFWVNVLLVLLLMIKIFLVCLLMVVIFVSLRVILVLMNVWLILVKMFGVFRVFNLISVVLLLILKKCILVGMLSCFICWGNFCLFLCECFGFLSWVEIVFLMDVMWDFEFIWLLLFLRISMLLNI